MIAAGRQFRKKRGNPIASDLNLLLRDLLGAGHCRDADVRRSLIPDGMPIGFLIWLIGSIRLIGLSASIGK
jgi:hypothetical protein